MKHPIYLLPIIAACLLPTAFLEAAQVVSNAPDPIAAPASRGENAVIELAAGRWLKGGITGANHATSAPIGPGELKFQCGVNGELTVENGKTRPTRDESEESARLPRPDEKPADMSKPVKVFILLGQSNMVGMGDVSPVEKKGTLEHLTRTEKKYSHLLDESGKWTVRSDVRYVQVMQKGDNMQTLKNDWHTLQGKAIGPELQFGHIMGHVLDEPVLILKSCIGNRSLGWDLLPPGSERYVVDGKTYAGYKDTPDSWVEGQPKKEVPWYAGKQYDDDIGNAKRVLERIGDYYPGATKHEVAGFVWWQGHKDQNPVHASRYEQNLVRLIQCLRKDFNAPKAPFVLATIGFGGWELKEPGLTIANAQLAVGDAKKHPEFAGSVKCVETRDFWRAAEVSPNPRQGYHYNRNAETFMDVGNSLGRAMTELLRAGN